MPKVRGIERFADAMSNCGDGYVLIGGGACSVLFDNEGILLGLLKIWMSS